MRASVGVASVLDPRASIDGRKEEEKKREKRDANSFSPLSLPTPHGNSHRLRVTVFVMGRTRRSKRMRARERERERLRMRVEQKGDRREGKEGLEEEEPPSNKFEYRCPLNPIEGVRQKSLFT